jgi:hypothetical protein
MEKDGPESRLIQLPDRGRIVATPHLGGQSEVFVNQQRIGIFGVWL